MLTKHVIVAVVLSWLVGCDNNTTSENGLWLIDTAIILGSLPDSADEKLSILDADKDGLIDNVDEIRVRLKGQHSTVIKYKFENLNNDGYLVDGHGKRVRVSLEDGKVVVSSDGPNGKAGDKDDLVCVF